MKKIAVVVSAALCMSSAAMAEMYVGGKIGNTSTMDACGSVTSCDDNSDGYGALIGYQATDNIALELGYDEFGKFTGAGMNDSKASAFTLAPKFSLPVLDKFDLYGKLGAAFVDYGNKNDPSFMGALGVDMHATDNLSVRIEYQKLTDVNNDLVRAEINMASIGLVYKFGGAEEAAPMVAEPVAEPVKEMVMPEPVVEVKTKTLNMKLDSSSSFTTGSSELSDDAKTQVAKVVMLLQTYPQAMVTVTGHTDSRGSEEFNQTLSEQRAQAVADEIIAEGIDVSRVTVVGMGESQPIASNDTATGREMNRRVEIDVPMFEYEAPAE